MPDLPLPQRLFPWLNRPEYPKNPEALQSALAWTFVREAERTARRDGLPLGLIFRAFEKSSSKKIYQQQTWPDQAEQLWPGLRASGLERVEGLTERETCEALLHALEGVRPAKAKGIAAVPLTPAAAFLQNAVGVHAKTGPPDYALIIEQMFRMGAKGESFEHDAAYLYFRSLSAFRRDPFLNALNNGIERWIHQWVSAVPRDPDRGKRIAEAVPPWLTSASTPFHWFNLTWGRFCQTNWREVLPPRRWSDWASCILRTAIGQGFLWEAAFFRALGRDILSDGPSSAVDNLLKANSPLLHWTGAALPVGARDVNARILRTVADGQQVRAKLVEELDKANEPVVRRAKDWRRDLSGFVLWARQQKWRDDLNECFGKEARSAANNTIETIRYLLLTRDEGGAESDFYGLLVRRSRRFLCVQPGAEWIVVVASLAAEKPQSRTNLGEVRSVLRQLGVQVSRETLVSELERAGLMKSSHDADDAILVQSAF